MKKSIIAAALLGMLMSSCKTDEVTPTEVENTTDSTKNNTDTTSNVEAPAQSIVVNNETIKTTNIGFASGQTRGNIESNTLNLKDIIMFWSNDDTGNSLNAPADGNYTLIEADNGSVTEKGKVGMRITVSNDVFAFYSSKATSGSVEVKKVDGYLTYIFKNVTLNQVVTGTSTGLTPSSITVSGTLGGDPHKVVNSTKASSMSYVVNDAKTTVSAASYSSSGSYIKINSTDCYIYFKAETSELVDGTYKIYGAQNVYADAYSVKNADECMIAYFGKQYYSITQSKFLTIKTIDGKKNVSFEDVLLTSNAKDQAPFYPMSADFNLE